jgi:hypothetical protein
MDGYAALGELRDRMEASPDAVDAGHAACSAAMRRGLPNTSKLMMPGDKFRDAGDVVRPGGD